MQSNTEAYDEVKTGQLAFNFKFAKNKITFENVTKPGTKLYQAITQIPVMMSQQFLCNR